MFATQDAGAGCKATNSHIIWQSDASHKTEAPGRFRGTAQKRLKGGSGPSNSEENQSNVTLLSLTESSSLKQGFLVYFPKTMYTIRMFSKVELRPPSPLICPCVFSVPGSELN